MERCDRRIDLDGPGERPERVLEPTLTDVHLGQVVHRPGVTPVQHDRPLERLDRPGRIPELALHSAEHAVDLVRRRVDLERRFGVRQRLLRLALLGQHPAQVQAALHVSRVLLQRLCECLHRGVAVARLPGREPEHVEAPDILRVLARIAREQPHRFVVALLGEGGLGAVERHGSRGDGTARGRHARPLGRHGRHFGRVRVARLGVLVPAPAGDERGDNARDDDDLPHGTSSWCGARESAVGAAWTPAVRQDGGQRSGISQQSTDQPVALAGGMSSVRADTPDGGAMCSGGHNPLSPRLEAATRHLPVNRRDARLGRARLRAPAEPRVTRARAAMSVRPMTERAIPGCCYADA